MLPSSALILCLSLFAVSKIEKERERAEYSDYRLHNLGLSTCHSAEQRAHVPTDPRSLSHSRWTEQVLLRSDGTLAADIRVHWKMLFESIVSDWPVKNKIRSSSWGSFGGGGGRGTRLSSRPFFCTVHPCRFHVHCTGGLHSPSSPLRFKSVI